MKITYLIDELSIRGGTHKQLLRLCQYSEKQNLDFEIINKSNNLQEFGYREFSTYNDKIKHFKASDDGTIGKRINQIKVQFEIAKYLKNSNPDIINIHDNGFQYVIVFSKILGIKSKIFWQINDLPSCFRVGNVKNAKWKVTFLYSQAMMKLAAKLTNKITVNVSKNKERVKKKLNADAEVLYCGIDNDFLNIETIEKKINLPKIKLLSIGVFFPYRNYETIIHAVKILSDKNYEVELNIVGSTKTNLEYFGEIKSLINNLKLDQNIKILGNVDEEQLQRLFEESEIFLFLNIDQSWGLAVFEAIANSLPVIVSNSVGATELLDDNKTALIKDPQNASEIANCIEELATNPTLFNTIVIQGKSAISEMSWDKMYCSKLIGLFKNE